jgi:hypothetical protein
VETSDRDFNVALGLWGVASVTVLGAGILAFVDGHYLWGLILTPVGAAGMLYLHFHLKGRKLRIGLTLQIAMLVLTWAFLGFDIYQRREEPVGFTSVEVDQKVSVATQRLVQELAGVQQTVSFLYARIPENYAAFAIGSADDLAEIPAPCTLIVTAPDEYANLRDNVSFIIARGKCHVIQNLPPADADQPIVPNSKPGVILHWDSSFHMPVDVVRGLGQWFNLEVSHKIPGDDPHLIWIDIGPGRPWK